MQTEILEYANLALLKNSNEVEENYNILFESTNRLESLQENIQAIQQAIPRRCSNSYSDSAKKIAEYRLALVEKLKSSIDRRLLGLNSEMQVQNLRFNRGYSWVVGLLIVIQIVLASLTIDWKSLSDKLDQVKLVDTITSRVSIFYHECIQSKQSVVEIDKNNKQLQPITKTSSE